MKTAPKAAANYATRQSFFAVRLTDAGIQNYSEFYCMLADLGLVEEPTMESPTDAEMFTRIAAVLPQITDLVISEPIAVAA